MKDYAWLREQFETEEARKRLAKVKKLAAVADNLGTTLPQLGLAWCLKNPHVSSVITGASKPKQVKENMKAGELVDQLTDQVMSKDRIDPPEQPDTVSHGWTRIRKTESVFHPSKSVAHPFQLERKPSISSGNSSL